MAKFEFKEVRPGDMIQASLINRIIAYAQDLETRIASLEAGVVNVVHIDRITPEGVTLEEGTAVTIEGRNFSPNASDNTIMFAEAFATKFTDSGSDKTLKILVPHVTSITNPAGTEVTIMVRNGLGSADSMRRVVKNRVEGPVGSGKVGFKAIKPLQLDALVNAKNRFELTFPVSVTATLPGNYQITATNDKGWPVTITSANPLPIAGPNNVEVSGDVVLTIQVPDGTPASTTTVLSVTAVEMTAGTKVQMAPSPDVIFTAGSAAPTPETGITIVPGSVLIGSYTNGRIQFARAGSQPFTFPLLVTVAKAGSYLFEYDMENPTGWKKGVANNLGPSDVTSVPTTIKPNQAWSWDVDKATSTNLIFRVLQAQTKLILVQYRFPVDLTTTP